MRQGFTLAELLIVVAMLSLLMVSISPLLRGNQDQAMLSRQADIVRQSFYETVMKAKTGAVETGATQLPVRGFLISKDTKEIAPLTLQTLSFEDAQSMGTAAILTQATKGGNLLQNDAGKVVTRPLSTIETIEADGQQVTTLLLLFEPVSNTVATWLNSTKQGTPLQNVDVTIQHADSNKMRRTLRIQPETGTIIPLP